MEREYRIAMLNGQVIGYRHQVAELEEYIRLLYGKDFTSRFDEDELRTVTVNYEIQLAICERRIEEIKLELGDDLEE